MISLGDEVRAKNVKTAEDIKNRKKASSATNVTRFGVLLADNPRYSLINLI